MIDKKDISIIIPTMLHDRALVAIKECLESLYESSFPRENIIVVVNGGNVPRANTATLFEGVRVVTLRDDQGQCKAVNAAVAMTNTPWVFITNDDMVYPLDWFEKLTDPVDKFLHSGDKVMEPVSCMSPQLIEPRDGAPTFVKYFCGGIGGDWDKEKFMNYAENEHLGGGLRTGFNFPLLIKRELWDLVGGYDINYDPWGSNSDSDLQYKIMLAGIQPMQNTNCPVYHFSNTSDTFIPENNSYWQANFAYFKRKWGFDRTDDRIWESDFVIPDEERVFRPSFEGFYQRGRN